MAFIPPGHTTAHATALMPNAQSHASQSQPLQFEAHSVRVQPAPHQQTTEVDRCESRHSKHNKVNRLGRGAASQSPKPPNPSHCRHFRETRCVNYTRGHEWNAECTGSSRIRPWVVVCVAHIHDQTGLAILRIGNRPGYLEYR